MTTRARDRRRSPVSRVTAVLLAAMAVAAGTELVSGSPAGYVVLLVGCLLMGSAAAAVRMWWHNCFESRLAAVVLAVLAAVGQLLSLTMGRPGAGSAHLDPAGLVVVLLGVVVPLLVALDGRGDSRPETPERPYAL